MQARNAPRFNALAVFGMCYISYFLGPIPGALKALACISHHSTVEAHDMTARTSLRLLAVLNVPSSTPARAKRLAPSPDGPLPHFASPRGEKCRLNPTSALRLACSSPWDDGLKRNALSEKGLGNNRSGTPPPLLMGVVLPGLCFSQV